MKLALISYLHGAGGAERQIILLANEMTYRNHEVHLIILCDNKAPYPIENTVIIHNLSNVEKGNKLDIFRRYLSLRKVIKTIKPDITINYNFQGVYFSLLIGKKYTGKVLYSERGDPYDKEYSGLLGVIRYFSVKIIDAFVFQSEGARDFFKIKETQRAIIIHNSVTVSPNKYPIVKHRDNRIVSVGRLHPQKNQMLLIDSFSKIADKYPNLNLEIYGDGELKKTLQDKINNLHLQHRVNLLPSRKDIFDCIRTARLFVLTSDYEGMPNSLMEAMALGLPCISTDCRPGGAKTLIENGVNGFIVPLRDSNAIASKIEYLIDNPSIAGFIANNAQHIVETHTNEVIFDRWNNFLLSL